jgi:hypothetical protein
MSYVKAIENYRIVPLASYRVVYRADAGGQTAPDSPLPTIETGLGGRPRTLPVGL